MPHPGAVDTTYGTSGIAPLSMTSLYPGGAVVMDDDSVTIASTSFDKTNLVVERLDTSGAHRTSFGTGGSFSLAPSAGLTWGESVSVTGTSAMGRFYVLADTRDYVGVELRAFSSAGVSDSTFGVSGATRVNFTSAYMLLGGVFTQGTGGRLFFGGAALLAAGYTDMVIAGLASNGTGATTYLQAPGPPVSGHAKNGYVRSTATIGVDTWFAGYFATGSQNAPVLDVVRNGALASMSIAGEGSLIGVWDLGSGKLAVLRDTRTALSLLHRDAAGPDATFGTNGEKPITACTGFEIRDVLGRADGGFYTLSKCSSDRVEIARYDAAGSLVTTFGASGLVEIPQQNPRFLRMQADGKLLVITSDGVLRLFDTH